MARTDRPTIAELDRRVELVRDMLAKCWTVGMIKRAIRKDVQDRTRQTHPPTGLILDARTIWRYVSRARKQIEEDAALGRKILRARSHGFYNSVLTDPKTETKDKIKACERLDKLHGLEAPAKHQFSGTMKHKNAPPTADDLPALKRILRAATDSPPVGPAQSGTNGTGHPR